MNDIRRLIETLSRVLDRETAGLVAWKYEYLRGIGCVLLPPPGPDQSSGEYAFGDVIWNNRFVGTFGLREQELSQHVGIFGRTGAGKTN